jgi:hypothetical protein
MQKHARVVLPEKEVHKKAHVHHQMQQSITTAESLYVYKHYIQVQLS